MTRSARPRGDRRVTPAPAFTLTEMLIVVTIIAIAAAVALPRMTNTDSSKVMSAARLLAADLALAQIESVTKADDPRRVVFDRVNQAYQIEASSDPDTPITDPVTKKPYRVEFGKGRARELGGVTISAISVGGDDVLGFGAYGQTDQGADATITLRRGESTAVLTVAASSGEVGIAEGN